MHIIIKHLWMRNWGRTVLSVFLKQIDVQNCFFLYYFTYTTKKFLSYKSLVEDLHVYCEYDKTIRFFRKHPLHSYFSKKGGSIDAAIKNAIKSQKYKEKADADGSFSELGVMFKELLYDEKQK